MIDRRQTLFEIVEDRPDKKQELLDMGVGGLRLGERQYTGHRV